MQAEIAALQAAPIRWFADWPVRDIPATGSVVYTIWNRAGAFLYVGMAGRSATASAQSKGPFGRLESHASGRRSGDPFCLDVCDRFVLPRVHNRIAEIAEGRLSLDALTREYIRSELGFRFIAMPSPAEAFVIERALRRGDWSAGWPILNPLLS